MSADPNFILIRNYELWSHLSDDEYNELAIEHCYLEARKGEYIYFEAFNHNKLYFLKKGYIRIGYIDDTGKEVIREILQRGEIFGQFTLERNNLHGEFAQAYKEDVSLCAFNIHDFEQLLRKKPEISLKFSRQLGNKLYRIQNRLENLLHKDIRTRLVDFLLSIIQEGDYSHDRVSIINYLTHEDISHLIGASRQTITTTINDLAKAGLLEFNRTEIIIPSVKELQKQRIVI
jgi:CRP/FNR family transcriptional regulator